MNDMHLRAEPTLWQMVVYFLRLGALGFGGPVALANYMRTDLVEARHWLTVEEYENGLALAAACPGPLAYQLGVYCGYVRFGVIGGLAIAVAFGFAPFLIVTLAASLYVRFADRWQVRALFYGIPPVVLALIIKASWNLGKRTLRKERVAWSFAIVGCILTVVLQKELVFTFIVAGAAGAFAFGRRSPATETALPAPNGGRAKLLSIIPAFAISGGSVWNLFVFFFGVGLLVHGSGLVIVPFLKTLVVDQFHWLNDRQFLDSVAIGMISPGPVVITATFVGYLLNATSGALAATVGIFLPPVLFTVLATPIILRYYKQRRVAGVIRGIGVTVVGVLAGTTWLVGKEAVVDWVTAAIGIVSLVVVLTFKKLPDPFVVLAGGVIGLLTYHAPAKQHVLFLCPHGGARSRIAASYSNRTAEAVSIGRDITPPGAAIGNDRRSDNSRCRAVERSAKWERNHVPKPSASAAIRPACTHRAASAAPMRCRTVRTVMMMRMASKPSRTTIVRHKPALRIRKRGATRRKAQPRG